MKKISKDLTEGSIIRNIGHLALPMVISNLLQNVFNIVDMFFVGKLGPSALAAVGMSGIIMGFLFTLIIGISTGTVAMVSRFIGAKDFKEAENVAMQSIILGLLCYAFLAVIGYPLTPYILEKLGASEEVIPQGTEYLRIMFLGSFTIFIGFVLTSVLRAAGDAFTPMLALALSTILNIILDPALIFGWWIFPRLEVAGSALATVTARAVGVVVLLWVFHQGSSIIHLKISNAKIDFSIMWRIIKIGVFGSIQAVLRNTSGLILMRLVAVYGTFAVAAYVVGMRLQMIIMMPSFGLAAAVATLVGQNLGANKPQRAERTAWITSSVGFAIMTFFGILYIIFAKNIISFFNDNTEVIEIGVNYLYIIGGTLGFIGLSIILGRAFNGAGDTLSPMVITAIGLLILRIGLSLLFSWKFGLVGIWIGLASSSVIQGLMIAFWFNTGRWKLKKI